MTEIRRAAEALDYVKHGPIIRCAEGVIKSAEHLQRIICLSRRIWLSIQE